MSNKDYKKEILVKLIKKYNSRVAKNISTNRPVQLRPAELYKKYADNNADIEEKQQIDEAVKALSELQVVRVDFLKYSRDIGRICLCEEKVDRIHEFLKDNYGIIPQSTIWEQTELLLSEYRLSGQLVQAYCKGILAQKGNPGYIVDVERVEANLKMLHFLEDNKEELYVRELSMLVYGDSKWFELNNYDEVCNIIREVSDLPEEGYERNDTVLALYHIKPVEQEIWIKGNWRLEWDGYVIETAKLEGGIAIASNDIPAIRRITLLSSVMMTIENKTSFQRMGDSDTAVMYLGGFASRFQVLFLKKVIKDNPQISYYHFGDIDAGGFLIHRHLCQAADKNFILYCMGIDQLTDPRYRSCLKELSGNDVARLEGISSEKLYQKVAEYMKENNVKLEQEIISYYMQRKR